MRQQSEVGIDHSPAAIRDGKIVEIKIIYI
jgi:hypothetical protein